MNVVDADRLQRMCDEIWDCLCRAGNFGNYEALIATIRPHMQDKETSPAPWLHKIARETYPTKEPDTIKPEQFHGILGLIDNREKAYAALRSLPDSAVPEIETFLRFVIKEFLPSMRSQFETVVKELPYRRRGGPKTSSMPSEKACREICEEISTLHTKHRVLIGDAERRVVEKRGLSLRTVQRIWADRKQYLGEKKK